MKTNDLSQVRRTLWSAADELRANSTLSPAEYRGPVLGLIFLAYAEFRFEQVRPELEAKATARRPVTPDDYRAKSVLFVPDAARLSQLVELPEGENLGKAIDEAMKAIEDANPELREVLPRGYQRMEKSTLTELLRLFDGVEEAGASGDGGRLQRFLELFPGFLGVEEDAEPVLSAEQRDAGVGGEFIQFFEECVAGRIDEGEIAGPVQHEKNEEIVGLIEESSDFERLAVDGELQFRSFGRCAVGEPEGNANAGGGGFDGRRRFGGERVCRKQESRCQCGVFQNENLMPN